jgi:hypothetical protein
MAIYEYECVRGHTIEKLRREAVRNDPILCDECHDEGLSRPRIMYRRGIELQKPPRVVGGTLKHHRNEQRYTRGIG